MGLPAGRPAACLARRRRRPPRGQAGTGRKLTLLGLAGWSGSGKTTLLEQLLPALRALGLSVSTIKHTHHAVDLDQPGKDSFRHRAAGAHEVMVVSAARWALLHELASPAGVPALAARMAPVDLILVEGFKTGDFPRIEVHRPALDRPALWPGAAGIIAVASDAALPHCPLPVLPLNQPGRIATWIAGWLA